MNWTQSPAAENQPGHSDRLRQEAHLVSGLPSPSQQGHSRAQSQGGWVQDEPPRIRIRKGLSRSTTGGNGKDLDVFKLTLGDETIELLPLRNWSQLDHYKWTVRGKLPGAPAGLEIALDHVRMAGETVAINDPEGCEKLERLFNDWFLLERETLELARKKARPQPSSAAPESLAQPESQALRFRVEVDKRGQVHIHCVRGKETLASIGLSVAGFKSLYQQGLMRKPNTLESGALHDWVELDGELCSFEKGQDAAVRLEQILNERYVPAATVGPAKEVAIFLNPASSSGFDIQFPIVVAGVPDNHRRHLDEQSLGLLQDPDHCGLLHRELIIKLIPPNLVFKRKTPDGGEHYLAWGPEHTVNVTDEEGQLKTIQLSQPLNLLRLGRTELNAVFNHPTINRHTKAASPDQASSVAEPKPAASSPQTQTPSQPTAPPVQPIRGESRPDVRKSGPESATKPDMAKSVAMRVNLARPAPNLWLEEILAQPLYHHEWIACLMYRKMAEWFGNSNAGNFGPCDCWFISRGELEDIAHPEFHGIFITEKGSLGFLNKGQMARFYNRIAFIGPQQSALEGIQVDLVAVGLDARQRLVFILNDNYRRQFSVPEMILAEALSRLRDNGAVVLSVRETLANPEPLDVVWIVPAEQPDPSSPEAQEHTRAPG